MVGPGPSTGPTRLQGSAGVEHEAQPMEEYQQFEVRHAFEQYQAFVAHSALEELIDDGYTEAPYRAPGYGEDQA